MCVVVVFLKCHRERSTAILVNYLIVAIKKSPRTAVVNVCHADWCEMYFASFAFLGDLEDLSLEERGEASLEKEFKPGDDHVSLVLQLAFR